MDNLQLYSTIQKIPMLKHFYLGSFPADFVPRKTLPYNKFCIINTDNSDKSGTHWIMLARRDNYFYYGDSMGKPLKYYSNIKVDYRPRQMVWLQLQRAELCGLYSIMFAYKLFTDKDINIFDDFEVVKFFSMYE